MIAMDVRVDEEPDAAVRYLFDRRDDLVRERGELTVNEEDSVGPDECANRSSLTLERVEVIGELGGLDLDLAEIGLRGSGSLGASGPTCATLPLRARRDRHQCGRCQHRYRETEHRFRHGSRSLKPKAYTNIGCAGHLRALDPVHPEHLEPSVHLVHLVHESV